MVNITSLEQRLIDNPKATKNYLRELNKKELYNMLKNIREVYEKEVINEISKDKIIDKMIEYYYYRYKYVTSKKYKKKEAKI